MKKVYFVDNWRIKQTFSGEEDGAWWLAIDGWFDPSAEDLRAIRAYQLTSQTCLDQARAYLKKYYGTSNLFRIKDGQDGKGNWVVVDIVSLGADMNPRAEVLTCK